jgi:hypothetical protein
MANNLGTFTLAGGVLTFVASGSNDITNLPNTGDYISIGSEKFVFHSNAASASAYGYVWSGRSVSESIQNLTLAINVANQQYFTRTYEQSIWPKTDIAFLSDRHFDGRYQSAQPFLNLIATASLYASGSAMLINNITNTMGF